MLEIIYEPKKPETKTFRAIPDKSYFRLLNGLTVLQKIPFNCVSFDYIALIPEVESAQFCPGDTKVIPCDQSGKPLEPEVEKLTFGAIEKRCFFQFKGNLYFSISSHYALSIDNGEVVFFDSHDLVTPVKAKLIVEG